MFYREYVFMFLMYNEDKLKLIEGKFMQLYVYYNKY